MKCNICGREFPDNLDKCPFCNSIFDKNIDNIKTNLNYLNNIKRYLEELLNNIEKSVKNIERSLSEIETSYSNIKSTTDKEKKITTKEIQKIGLSEKREKLVEEFLGEKLLLTIGIVAILFATAFFLKYSYENKLFTPFIRVMITTFLGLIFIFFGYLLKLKYKIFGIILLTGGIAILFFSNFASVILFNFYGTTTAFLLNILLVISSLFLSIRFDSQWVSIVGIGGAYLSPLSLKATLTNDIGFFTYLFTLSLAPFFLAYKKKWEVTLLISNLLNLIWFSQWYSNYFKANVSIYFIYFGIWYFTAFLIVALFFLRQKSKYNFYLLSALISTFFYPLFSIKTLILAKKQVITPSIIYVAIGLLLLGITYLKNFKEKEKLFLFTSGILTILTGIYINYDLIYFTSFLAITAILSIYLYFITDIDWLFTLSKYLLFFIFLKVIFYDFYNNFSFDSNNFVFTNYKDIASRILEYIIITAAFYISIKIDLKKEKKKFSKITPFFMGISILFFLTCETSTAFYTIFHKEQSMAVSILWAIFAFILLFLGLKRKNKDLRSYGLGLFIIVLFKLFLIDIKNLSALYRIMAFFLTGIVLILSSYFYFKFKNKEEIKKEDN